LSRTRDRVRSHPGPRTTCAVAAALIASVLAAIAGDASASMQSTSPTADPIPRARWVIDENQRAGTTRWMIAPGTPRGIEGYANRVSAVGGQEVQLHVSTSAPRFHVEAYRIGYYGGLGGRLVWRSRALTGGKAPAPAVLPRTNTVEARWPTSLRVRITRAWVQGDYLLKLVSSVGGQAYVPLTVRDDTSTAALVVQNAVTTWQAYNRWGGYSLYQGPDGSFASRSRMVSFDRPYRGRDGASAFPWMEQPLVALVERDGMDVTYQTDVDLHAHPQRLLQHRALISLGHDEYWSAAMRNGVLAARAAGVNLAFLGANAIYRHIRFAPSPLGRNRRVISYKVAREDPLYGVDDQLVTSNWRDPPIPRPESVVVGALYRCADAHEAPLVVTTPNSWVYAGTGLGAGDRLPGVVHLEVDDIQSGRPTPDTIEILARSPVTCSSGSHTSDMTYYTTTSGAGVFDAGDQGWMDSLECLPAARAASCSPAIEQVTQNVLAGLGHGPAARLHPSNTNVGRFGIRLRKPIHP
jgi:hypothetical protein